MSIVIHIGMQKTGTTFLQKTLYENRAQLLEQGVLYPDPVAGLTGNDVPVNAHHWLAHAIQNQRKLFTPTPDFTNQDAHVAALRRAAAEHPNATCVLSSEEFSVFDHYGIAALRRHFPGDTRIIVYLRRQDEWLDSLYAQLVKVGRNITAAELFEKEKRRLDYASWLALWARYFGAKNIIVRVYEGFGPEKSIWDDFLASIGRPQASEVRPASESANQSLAYELTLFSKAQHIYGEQRCLRHLLDKVNNHFPRRAGLKYISPELAREILAASARSNSAVARKYLQRDRLFADNEVSAALETNGMTVEQLAQVVGGISIRLIARINKLEKRLQDHREEKAKLPPIVSPFLYATRSLLPSKTIHSLHSGEMACSLDRLLPNFMAVYRSSEPAGDPRGHFAAYGLTPPRRTHVLQARSPWLNWIQPDLSAFRTLLRYQPHNTLVYTRSSRLSWVSVSTGLTTFIELHGPLTRVRMAWIRHLLETHRLPGIVTTTLRLKKDLLAAFPLLNPERILVAGGAASAALLQLPALPLSGRRDFNVGYAGSALQGKGLEVVLACAARMPKAGFHVIGLRPEECAERGPVAPNVVFHGYKPSHEAVALLKGMDALLLPQQRPAIIRRGSEIGAPPPTLKPCEYLAVGRPIVAARLPAFTDVLRDDENALLAPPEDIDALCKQLRRLQSEPSLGRSLGIQAQRDFAAGHTWEHRARRVVEFINHQAPLAA